MMKPNRDVNKEGNNANLRGHVKKLAECESLNAVSGSFGIRGSGFPPKGTE